MHFATMWEQISEVVPDQPVLINGDNIKTWREYDDRAARLASALTEHGLAAGAKIGLYIYNSNEYQEAQYAIFKISACPINVNYRYQEDELVYLLDNSDSEALFYHACFADRIEAIKSRLPDIKLYIQIDDDSAEALLEGSLDYETLIAQHDPMPRIERSSDETYMLYTGGTTGMPKGVMYNMGEFCNGMFMGYTLAGMPEPISVEETVAAVTKLKEDKNNPVTLVCCPLMHGTGVWLGSMVPMLMGGTVVTIHNHKLDAHELWQAVQTHKVKNIVIVGDAFARPMLDALDEAKEAGNPYDISSVASMQSSGVMWTTEVKQGLLEHHDMMLVDALGATEGSMGKSVMMRGMEANTAKFIINDTTKVFSEDGRLIAPGSGEIGLVANGGFCPIGYYKDPEKSAATFKVIDGARYSFPGDYATVETDGTITLLGRGSMSINTMGEKVYPEEVEEAIKTHTDIYDCLVVGVKDPKFNERITALVSYSKGGSVSEDDLIDHVKQRLSSYKKPKNVFFVDKVQRAINGKADYKWAKARAVELYTNLTA